MRHLHTSIATGISVDLHVLGTPPTFILSQDQTLRLIFSIELTRLFALFCYLAVIFFRGCLPPFHLTILLLSCTTQYYLRVKAQLNVPAL